MPRHHRIDAILSIEIDMKNSKPKWLLGVIGALVLLLVLVGWRQLKPRQYELVYTGHKFEYLEPPTQSKNRSAQITLWVGYSGDRPRWWGERLNSQIRGGHQWSFSNGIGVTGGGGIPASAVYNTERDSYQYELEKGLTAYQAVKGEMVAVADGDATQCELVIEIREPQKPGWQEIPLTLDLRDGQEVKATPQAD
jgi:hypothetical protein